MIFDSIVNINVINRWTHHGCLKNKIKIEKNTENSTAFKCNETFNFSQNRYYEMLDNFLSNNFINTWESLTTSKARKGENAS